MKLNRMGNVLCACAIVAVFGVSAVAAPANGGEAAFYGDEKAMEANIKKAVEYCDMAAKSFNEGDLSRARKYVDQSLELDPGNQEALDLSQKITERASQKGAVPLESGKQPGSALSDPAVEKETQKRKAKGNKYYESAREYFDKGNLSRAQKNITKSLEYDPKNQQALDLNRKIAERVNRDNAGLLNDAQQKAVTGTAAVGSARLSGEKEIQKNNEKAFKYYEASRRDYYKGNLSSAQKNIDSSLKYDAYNQAAIELKQKITVALLQEDVALDEKKKSTAPDISSSSSNRWLKRAQKAYKTRDIAAALAYCTTALEADPSNEAAARLKKRLQVLQTRLDAVKRDMFEAFVAKGSLLIKEENPLEAIWWLNRAAAIDPDDSAIDGLLLTAQERARNILPGITKAGDRRKVALIAKYFTDDNFVLAERTARELQKDYPLAGTVTKTIQSHLMDVANEDRSNEEYGAALNNAVAGRFENASDEIKRSLYFNPFNYAARCLQEQIQFEILEPAQSLDI